MPDLSPDHIPARVRDEITARGLTVAAAAAAAGLPAQSLRNLLSGQRPDPRASTLIRLASALRISVDSLLRPPK